MLRRYRRPERIDSAISKFFMALCAVSLPIYGLSNGYFMCRLGDEGVTYIIEISLLSTFLLVKYYLTRLNRQQSVGWIFRILKICDITLGLTQFQHKYMADSDYDPLKFGKRDYLFLNPVTRKEAEEINLHYRLGIAKTQDEKDALTDKLANLADNMKEDFCKNVGNSRYQTDITYTSKPGFPDSSFEDQIQFTVCIYIYICNILIYYLYKYIGKKFN